mgnify:FL=1
MALCNERKTPMIDDCVSKAGKKFSAFFILDDELDCKIQFDDSRQTGGTIRLTCPKCGKSELQSTTYQIRCDCGLKLNKSICGHTLTEEETSLLLTGKQTPVIKGLQGKSKKFDAAFKMNANMDGIDFVFPEK